MDSKELELVERELEDILKRPLYPYFVIKYHAILRELRNNGFALLAADYERRMELIPDENDESKHEKS